MRILQILNRVPWPLRDGGSIGYYNMIKGYHDAGCEVTVAAMNTTKHYVKILPPELTGIATWHTVPVDNRVKIIPAAINLFSSSSYHVERFISADVEQMLENILLHQQFDVIIFESLFTMPYIDIVRSHSNALIVLRQYNVEHRIWKLLAGGAHNPLKKWYLQLLARRLQVFEREQLNKADLITTVTEADAEALREMGCTRQVISFPLGIFIKPGSAATAAPEIPSLFHIGSMEWLPNKEAMRWFIDEVWQEVAKRHPDLQLYIAGRGMPESFRQLDSPNLHVLGEVADAETFMQQKQIMVVPLFSGSGIRIKILEAMALGKTIITTRLGAQGIDCENGKHLLLADNNQEFIKAIDLLVTNPQLAADLGANARQLILEKYDNTKVIADVLSFYQTYTERTKEHGV
jgi:glycosyltransferase involved in cell wall biosynthesis